MNVNIHIYSAIPVTFGDRKKMTNVETGKQEGRFGALVRRIRTMFNRKTSS